MDQKRIIKYFTPKPSIKPVFACIFWGIISIALGIGIVDFLEGKMNDVGTVQKVLFGIGVFLILSAVLKIGSFGGRATDKEIDALLQKKLRQLRGQAKRKLGFEDEEISLADPIEMVSYNLGRDLHDATLDSIANKYDPKKNLWRAPEAVLTGFYFTEDHLAFYQWRVSLVSDTQREDTNEVYYQDIVSLKTAEQETVPTDPKTGQPDTSKRIRINVFVVTNRGAEHLYGFGPVEQLENAQHAMRALLREKKR